MNKNITKIVSTAVVSGLIASSALAGQLDEGKMQKMESEAEGKMHTMEGKVDKIEGKVQKMEGKMQKMEDEMSTHETKKIDKKQLQEEHTKEKQEAKDSCKNGCGG